MDVTGMMGAEADMTSAYGVDSRTALPAVGTFFQ
jgi:hypothetical protein